jgi:hypothetical protein
MPILSRDKSLLLVIDLQERLMPAIEGGEAVLAHARRLLEAAQMLGVPVVFTEQNPGRLGPTVPGLAAGSDRVVAKMTFDALGAAGFTAACRATGRLSSSAARRMSACSRPCWGCASRGLAVAVVRDAVGVAPGREQGGGAGAYGPPRGRDRHGRDGDL